jgi:hypothetical protein
MFQSKKPGGFGVDTKRGLKSGGKAAQNSFKTSTTSKNVVGTTKHAIERTV